MNEQQKQAVEERKHAFIEKATIMHGDRYDYSKVEYINTHSKVTIICPEHGAFVMTPHNHLSKIYKQGCKYCSGKIHYRPDLSHIETPEGSKAVPLTQGKYALVDEEDYDRVMQYRWCYTKTGYAHHNKLGRMHRFIMNTPDDMDTDHIDRDKLNNRKSNLRICNRSENSCNSIGVANSTSKYKGVCWVSSKNKWMAQITHKGKRKFKGYYQRERDAAKAYDEAAIKYHGEFALINFPQPPINEREEG